MVESKHTLPTAEELATWEALALTGNFEESMRALDRIVALLDDGGLPLETSVRCFEVGAQLSNRCTVLLEQAQLRISTIAEDGLLVGSEVADDVV